MEKRGSKNEKRRRKEPEEMALAQDHLASGEVTFELIREEKKRKL